LALLPRASILRVAFLSLSASFGVACATSGASAPGPAACERGVCARLVRREPLSMRVVVELTAPANASLHNAWVVEGAGPRCRGGRALNAVETDAGVRTNGPLSLSGRVRLTLTFAPQFRAGDALDLDVRFPDGPACLRLPFGTASPAPSGANAGDV
jgi:hypothetical protein